jgi:CRP-like cAMP-binding protein
MISPEILRRYPFFGNLSESQIKALANIAEEKTLIKGSVLFEEGTLADAFYLLMDGAVSLYFKTNVEYQPKSRKDFLVGEINPGEVFAISALVEPYIYTTTVQADKNSQVVKFDATALNGLIEKDPTLNCILMRKIASAAMERLASTRVQLAAAWAK